MSAIMLLHLFLLHLVYSFRLYLHLLLMVLLCMLNTIYFFSVFPLELVLSNIRTFLFFIFKLANANPVLYILPDHPCAHL